MEAALHSAALEPQKITTTNGEAPEWLHLLPSGTFSGVDGRGPYMVPDAEALVARFHSEGRKLPVDENHSTELAAKKGHPAPARGWIVDIQSRADGIWGKVEWTGQGKSMMMDKAYGFLSPVFLHGASKPYQVGKLTSVALTNDPNLKLTALNAAQEGGSVELETLLVELRAALDLADDADAAAIVASVKAAKSAPAAHSQSVTSIHNALGITAEDVSKFGGKAIV